MSREDIPADGIPRVVAAVSYSRTV